MQGWRQGESAGPMILHRLVNKKLPTLFTVLTHTNEFNFVHVSLIIELIDLQNESN